MNVMIKKNNVEKELENVPAKSGKWRWLTIYILLFLGALVYIYVFSDTNYQRHAVLRQKIRQVESENAKLQGYLENTHTPEEIRRSPALMEKHVREQLNMKRSDEDIFIIETTYEDQNN